MRSTLFVNITVNDDLLYITNLYCNYVNYLIDLLKPTDEEMLELFIIPFSKSKPKINYILKPLRQNAQLPKQFSRLAERRALALLRSFCRKVKKMFVKYNGEVRELLNQVPSPSYNKVIDLDDRVSKISGRMMQICFNDKVVETELEIPVPVTSKALQLDLDKKGALLLVPSIRYATGTQLGERFEKPSPQLDKI